MPIAENILTVTMIFGDALRANGKGSWMELKVPDEHSKMTPPYINYPFDAINTPGARVPWLASQTDMLAEDWRIVE